MNKKLKLVIQPKVIDHLGIKMYQKPVDVISEFIANSWDADAEDVNIDIQDDSILVTDDGIGMTFQECQNFYLTVGRNRREDNDSDLSSEKERPVLGRKGIGKFAGFGIAKSIIVETISKSNGESTTFKMNIDEILEYDAASKPEKPIEIISSEDPDEAKKSKHGTTVILEGLNINVDDIPEFIRELSRRFLLTQISDDFKITINDSPLPKSFDEDMEFIFPTDLRKEEKHKFPNIKKITSDGWAIEDFEGEKIKWRIGFFEDTIKSDELRGISIFAKGKLAQKPFNFELAGGISGQNALEYMTGQVLMDFIDVGDNDLIATERQRINLQTPLGKKIKEWGIELIKKLSLIWKKRRSEKRIQELNDKVSGFRDRLDKLPSTERKTVESVLKKIASFSRLGKNRFHEWSNAILTSWETGRLKNLFSEISEIEDLDETRFIELLTEADVLTALNMAELIQTKILTISKLKQLVDTKELENDVRDFIYEHPWLIHPKWESFKKERRVSNLIKDIGVKYLKGKDFKGRVDLMLSSGETLLLVEFMRPGLKLDRDHLVRCEDYVVEIREALKRETGNQLKKLPHAYVIADDKENSTTITKRIEKLGNDNIHILTWNTLVEEALHQYHEHLDIIKERNPNDQRIQDLGYE